jgi:hypothetical protein
MSPLTAVNGDNALNSNDLFGGFFASFLSDRLLKSYCVATRIQSRSETSSNCEPAART